MSTIDQVVWTVELRNDVALLFWYLLEKYWVNIRWSLLIRGCPKLTSNYWFQTSRIRPAPPLFNFLLQVSMENEKKTKKRKTLSWSPLDIEEELAPSYPICDTCAGLERLYKCKSDLDLLAYDNPDDCMPDWQDPYYFIKHVPPLPDHMRFRKPGKFFISTGLNLQPSYLSSYSYLITARFFMNMGNGKPKPLLHYSASSAISHHVLAFCLYDDRYCHI